ncbi:MAG: hypothetical protein ABJL55_02070 [Roseibium sp.]
MATRCRRVDGIPGLVHSHGTIKDLSLYQMMTGRPVDPIFRFGAKILFSLFSLKSRTCTNLTAAGAMALLMSTSALAQSKGLDAYNAYVAGLENLGLDIKNGSIDYDAVSDRVTLSDSVISLSGTIKDIPTEDASESDGDAKPPKLTDLSYSLSMSSDKVTISGLSQDGSTFSSKNWTYSDDTELLITGAATGEGRFKVDGRLAGTAVTNISFNMPTLPAQDTNRQVSRWLPLVKALALNSYDEARIDTAALTFEAYAGEKDDEFLVKSGTTQVDGHRVTDVRDGRIGEYSIDQTVQTLLTRDEATGQMLSQTSKQGKSSYQNVDTGAMIALFDPSVPATDDERTLMSYGSTVDYESSQDIGGGLTVGAKVDRSAIRGLTVTKRGNNFLEMLDRILVQDVPGAEDLIGGVFQLYRSFGIEDARASGISIDFPSLDEIASIDIREMAMTDVNSNGIGEMMIVGLDAPDLPDGASFKLDWAAIGDIEFADYPPAQAMIRTLIKDSDYGEENLLEVARALLPRSFSYEIEGLDANVPDTGRTQIDKAELTISSAVPPVPTNIYIKNDGIRIPVGSIEDQDAQALIRALGLIEVVWSDETRFTWEEATKDLRLERLKLNIEGLGTAEASAHFANVPRDFFEDPEGQGQVVLIMAQFVDAKISFVDDGLINKGLSHMAEDQNIPEAVFREVLVAQAVEAASEIRNAEFTEMVRVAVSDFLNNPGKISFAMKPANPVPLAQIFGSLAAPQSLPDLLNATVTAE